MHDIKFSLNHNPPNVCNRLHIYDWVYIINQTRYYSSRNALFVGQVRHIMSSRGGWTCQEFYIKVRMLVKIARDVQDHICSPTRSQPGDS